MTMTYGLLALGLVLLIAGGDTLVRGATTAARSLGVSPLLIGLTLVGMGTSAPELVTSNARHRSRIRCIIIILRSLG